jgi:hypothetical protein
MTTYNRRKMIRRLTACLRDYVFFFLWNRMTSVLSAFAEIHKLPTKFFSLITPSYEDTVIVPNKTMDMPIPFVVVNQVLDINVNQSSVVQLFVDNGTEPEDKSNLQAKAAGGASLIKSLGPNMTTYLRNWINRKESLGAAYTGSLVLHIQPFMTKVQMVNPKLGIDGEGAFERDRSWGFTTEDPVSGEYIGGGPTNNYFTAWVFKTPMTIRYEVAGGYKYLTMTTQFAEE